MKENKTKDVFRLRPDGRYEGRYKKQQGVVYFQFASSMYGILADVLMQQHKAQKISRHIINNSYVLSQKALQEGLFSWVV